MDHDAGIEDLLPAGVSTDFHREGIGRVRGHWGSSPAKYLGGKLKDLGWRRPMATTEWACISMRQRRAMEDKIFAT
jgi:hypothetical protein